MKQNRLTRIASAFLAIVMILLAVPTSVFSAFAASVGDSRTHTSCGLIFTAEDLSKIREGLDGTYVLMNDIDLSAIENWTPIGSSDTPFTGALLGAGYTVRGLKITTLPDAAQDGYVYAGLFGYNAGEIRDLRLEGNVVSPVADGKRAYVGSLVGYNAGSVINCYDGVDFDAYPMLGDNNLYPSAQTLSSTAPNQFELGTNGSCSLVLHGDGKIVNGLKITVSENAPTAVYLFLQGVVARNFYLHSQTTSNIYIISQGTRNTLYASNNNEAINLPNTTLTVLGDAPLVIRGDDGAYGANDNTAGASGTNGESVTKPAVSVKTLTVDMTDDAVLSIHGGNGGNGGDGVKGTCPASGTGGDGGRGGDGAKGGNGGIGLLATAITAYSPLAVYSGNGGKGGNAGAGGDGAKGKKGSTAGFLGYGGDGGTGGDGGSAGIGGSGGDVLTPIDTSIQSLAGKVYQFMGTVGAPGDAAIGGKGGAGGDGGSKGDWGLGGGNPGSPGTGQTHLTGGTGSSGMPAFLWIGRAVDTASGKAYTLYQNGSAISAADVRDKVGQLVSINSAEEQAFIDRLWQVAPDGQMCWIGLQRKSELTGEESDVDTWVWDDGSEIGTDSYTNWREGQPDNAANSEPHAHLYDSGEWNDYDKTAQAGVSCYMSEEDYLVELPSADVTAYGYATATAVCTYDDDEILSSRWDDVSTNPHITVEGNAIYYGSATNPHAILVGGMASDVDSFQIHADTEVIYFYSFYEFAQLRAISIPKNVRAIGQHAFDGCEKLVRVITTEPLSAIGDYAFNNCKSLGEMTLVDSSDYMQIGASAFMGCTSLERISLPHGLTEIRPYTFSGARKLAEIAIPAAVTAIGANAFEGCTRLTKVDFASDAELTSIGSSAFSGCTALEAILFPDKLETVGTQAFYGNTALKALYIPKQITAIGDKAFYGCSAVETILGEDGETYSTRGNCLVEKATGTLILGCSNSNLREANVQLVRASSFVNLRFEKPFEIPADVQVEEVRSSTAEASL